MKKYDNKPIMLRLNNSDVLDIIEEIESANIYKSKNELINKILSYGAPILYEKIFDKRKYTKPLTGGSGAEVVMEKLKDIEQRQKKESRAHDELIGLLAIIEYLTTTLVNIELAKINGETLSENDVLNGVYSTLPEKLEEIKKLLSGKID